MNARHTAAVPVALLPLLPLLALLACSAQEPSGSRSTSGADAPATATQPPPAPQPTATATARPAESPTKIELREIRVALETKADQGTVTRDELRMLALTCSYLDDDPCKERALARAAQLPGPAGEEESGDLLWQVARRLQPRVWSGKATIEEIRLLEVLCTIQGDRACRDRAAAMLKKAMQR